MSRASLQLLLSDEEGRRLEELMPELAVQARRHARASRWGRWARRLTGAALLAVGALASLRAW